MTNIECIEALIRKNCCSFRRSGSWMQLVWEWWARIEWMAPLARALCHAVDSRRCWNAGLNVAFITAPSCPFVTISPVKFVYSHEDKPLRGAYSLNQRIRHVPKGIGRKRPSLDWSWLIGCWEAVLDSYIIPTMASAEWVAGVSASEGMRHPIGFYSSSFIRTLIYSQ